MRAHHPFITIFLDGGAKLYEVTDVVATASWRLEKFTGVAVVIQCCEATDVVVTDRGNESVAIAMHVCLHEGISKALLGLSSAHYEVVGSGLRNPLLDWLAPR